MASDFVRISPELLAMHAADRAANEVSAALSGQSHRWAFAIMDTHLALTAALVATLSGSAGVGALSEKQRLKWLDYFSREHPRGAAPQDESRIAPFPELLERVLVEDGEWHIAGAVQLSTAALTDINRLNEFRNDLDHVKPTYWMIEIAGLPRICNSSATLLSQLFQLPAFNLHLSKGESLRARAAARRMLDATS